MARSIRILYRGQRGVIRKNWNWDAINLDSAVVITAAEFTPVFGGLFGPKTLGRPLLGAAHVFVTNVGPHGAGGEAGGVEFLLHVNWETPLDVVVTITVLDDIETFEQPQ
ncbi:hypothetical protein QEZ54_23315 [Catellatospora sp. KI3]|uniref:hypothetical protein n=1 Tax=Catellatospora sp. KI3 TaxID=3041620 RepID=UPI0024827701|nr:hypothetical protein [Catellatospora sp. KI3]MDI1463919.1 hypothetical protein [Catellatospora sp. KI3]